MISHGSMKSYDWNKKLKLTFGLLFRVDATSYKTYNNMPYTKSDYLLRFQRF